MGGSQLRSSTPSALFSSSRRFSASILRLWTGASHSSSTGRHTSESPGIHWSHSATPACVIGCCRQWAGTLCRFLSSSGTGCISRSRWMPTWSVLCTEAPRCHGSATGQPDEASESLATFLIQQSHCRNGPRRVYMRTVSLRVADSGCVLNCHLLAPGPSGSGSAPPSPRANAAAKAGVIRFHNATSGPVAAAKPEARARIPRAY